MMTSSRAANHTRKAEECDVFHSLFLSISLHEFITLMKMKMKNRSGSKTTNLLRPIIHVYGCPSTSLLLLLLLLLPPITRPQPSNASPSPTPRRHEANSLYTPSIVIIIVILILAFILMAFFSFYIRLRAGDIRARPSLLRSLTHARLEPSRGLEPAFIDSLPTFEYSAVKGLKLGCAVLECAVCLNEFQDDETLRLLPRCSHVFHTDCIGIWLVSRATCPVCRSDLLTADTDAKDPAIEFEAPVPATEDETSDEVPLHHVAVDVLEERDQMPIPNQECPIRSKSTPQALRFPRSHTTGHSLVQPGENLERFTLRLSEHVRKEIFDASLDRSASYGALRTTGPSGVGQFQCRFDRAAKSDRWGFLVAPAFLARAISVRSQKRGDGEQTATQPDPVRFSSPVFSASTE